MIKVIHKIKNPRCPTCQKRCANLALTYNIDVEIKARGVGKPCWEIYKAGTLVTTVWITPNIMDVPLQPIYQALNEIIKPSLFRKLVNYFRSKLLTKGKVSDKIYKSRLTKCDECPFLLNGDCSLCGCPVTEKCKYKYKKSKNYNAGCPKGIWQ